MTAKIRHFISQDLRRTYRQLARYRNLLHTTHTTILTCLLSTARTTIASSLIQEAILQDVRNESTCFSCLGISFLTMVQLRSASRSCFVTTTNTVLIEHHRPCVEQQDQRGRRYRHIGFSSWRVASELRIFRRGQFEGGGLKATFCINQHEQHRHLQRHQARRSRRFRVSEGSRRMERGEDHELSQGLG
jgi:hypothetical protein